MRSAEEVDKAIDHALMVGEPAVAVGLAWAAGYTGKGSDGSCPHVADLYAWNDATGNRYTEERMGDLATLALCQLAL